MIGWLQPVSFRRHHVRAANGPRLDARHLCEPVLLENGAEVGLGDVIGEGAVTESELISLKRLNNDTVAKAHIRRGALGTSHIVAAVMLAGVYKLEQLVTVQSGGLFLLWFHQMDAFSDFVKSARQ